MQPAALKCDEMSGFMAIEKVQKRIASVVEHASDVSKSMEKPLIRGRYNEKLSSDSPLARVGRIFLSDFLCYRSDYLSDFSADEFLHSTGFYYDSLFVAITESSECSVLHGEKNSIANDAYAMGGGDGSGLGLAALESVNTHARTCPRRY